MARGNQRDKAREKNLKEAAGAVSSLPSPPSLLYLCFAYFTIGKTARGFNS